MENVGFLEVNATCFNIGVYLENFAVMNYSYARRLNF